MGVVYAPVSVNGWLGIHMSTRITCIAVVFQQELVRLSVTVVGRICFHLAGPTFLPMPYLVLMAGLLFGWRVGLITGLFTPLASYTISGMPVVSVLPQIVVELSTYGLIAGLLRDKLNLGVLWSLLGAMVVGRLALLMAGWIASIFSGQSYLPIGVETVPLQALWAVIKQGWPGILIQLVTIPIIIFFVEKSVQRGLASGDE